MKQIVKDWIEFCEKGADFEDGHFYTLFTKDITLDEIKAVYRYFPNTERLVAKMKKFLFDPKPVILDYETKKNELERLIKLDFQERQAILQNIDAFANLNINLNFQFVKDVKVVNNLILDDVWSQSFQDFMRTQKIVTDKKIYELNNALYGISYDFDYQLYLFEPLLKTNYTGEFLFIFKRLGGLYSITEDGVTYSFE